MLMTRRTERGWLMMRETRRWWRGRQRKADDEGEWRRLMRCCLYADTCNGWWERNGRCRMWLWFLQLLLQLLVVLLPSWNNFLCCVAAAVAAPCCSSCCCWCCINHCVTACIICGIPIQYCRTRNRGRCKVFNTKILRLVDQLLSLLPSQHHPPTAYRRRHHFSTASIVAAAVSGCQSIGFDCSAIKRNKIRSDTRREKRKLYWHVAVRSLKYRLSRLQRTAAAAACPCPCLCPCCPTAAAAAPAAILLHLMCLYTMVSEWWVQIFALTSTTLLGLKDIMIKFFYFN